MRGIHLRGVVGGFSLLVCLISTVFAQAVQASSTGHNTTAPYPPGTVIHAASCEQAPPQSVKDRATYTPAELARYGLPPRSPNEPFDHWAQMVRAAGKRVCDRKVTNLKNTMDLHYWNWAGNIADEPQSGGRSYSEVDANFYVPCVTTGNYDSNASFWVGLGGVTNKNNNLVQTGIDAHHLYVANNGWYTTSAAWVENLGDAQNPDENDVFYVDCGDKMWVKAYNGNCMYIVDIISGVNSNQCYGPNANNTTAEAIAERPGLGPPQSYTLLADFGSVVFHGVGLVENGSYIGMNQANHDYSNMWAIDGSHELAIVGPIQYDSTDQPPDMYTVTWKAKV